MSKKDFKRGLNAGAKPFEDKFLQVEAAINAVGGKLNESLDGIQAVTEAVIDDLSAIQKKELYGLDSRLDVQELSSADKELLIAGLYTLAAMSDGLTEYQQTFIRAVQRCLNITTPQTSVDLSSAIDNIESIPAQKAILQTFIEFLFLENCNDSFLDDYEELLGFFNINSKNRNEILEQVHAVYHAAGERGISEKYGLLVEKVQLPDESDDPIVLENQFKLGEWHPDIAYDEMFNEPRLEMKARRTPMVIDTPLIVEEGQSMTISDRIITLQAQITVIGELIIENCEILAPHEPLTSDDTILADIFHIVIKGGNLRILSSEYIVNQPDESEIDIDIIAYIAMFKNYYYLIGLDDSIRFDNSKISEFYTENSYYNTHGFLYSSTSNAHATIKNCIFVDNIDNAKVRDGALINMMNQVYRDGGIGIIEDSMFVGTSSINLHKGSITGCIFNASGTICFSYYNLSEVENCIFTDIPGTCIQNARVVTLCRFTAKREFLVIGDDDEYGEASADGRKGPSGYIRPSMRDASITKCTFKNLAFKSKRAKGDKKGYFYLIGGTGFKKEGYYAPYKVDECVFENCTLNSQAKELIAIKAWSNNIITKTVYISDIVNSKFVNCSPGQPT